MSVFIKNKDEFDDLTPISFPHEIDLSNLIINNSEIFPITNYSEEGTKWIPISVEVQSIDFVFLIIVVEIPSGGTKNLHKVKSGYPG